MTQNVTKIIDTVTNNVAPVVLVKLNNNQVPNLSAILSDGNHTRITVTNILYQVRTTLTSINKPVDIHELYLVCGNMVYYTKSEKFLKAIIEYANLIGDVELGSGYKWFSQPVDLLMVGASYLGNKYPIFVDITQPQPKSDFPGGVPSFPDGGVTA